MTRPASIFAIALVLALLGASGARALTLQPVGTFAQPTYVTSDPGNPNRLYVVEREGKIELVENGVTIEFADLSSKVQCSGECEGERGLMSIALAPDFDASGRLYVDYANDLNGTIHVEEMTADPGGEHAEASSLRPLLSIPHPGAANHNGGQLQFGPEGDLYVSTGDGGGANDEFHNAQNLTTLLGKILRLRPAPAGPAPFYTVPPGNPFPAATPPADTIWSYGLRNPFRFSFDRLNGDMTIGDVGQAEREEVDYAPSPLFGAGANYGWNCREGLIEGPADDPGCAEGAPGAFSEPVFDYPHTPDPTLGDAKRCAIIGGYVARDPSLGALYGNYVYVDLCSGAIRSLRLPSTAAGRASDDCSLGLRVDSPVSFGEDSARHLYVVEEGGGVYRIAGLPPASCPAPVPSSTGVPRAQPAPTFVGIRAQRRRVERGKRALLTVWVSPCSGRKGQLVTLMRNGHADGSRFLSRACTARFLPKIRRGTTFAAATREEGGYLSGASRRLIVRLAPHRRR